MMTIKNKDLNAYSCGSPIRLSVIQAISIGSRVNTLVPNPNPIYLGGNSIVWGLIRGADKLMEETKLNGYDFFHVDNGYFGRNIFFRITQNNLQVCHAPLNIVDDRYKKIFNYLGLEIKPWNKKRNGPILICPSSEFLYSFYGTTLEKWIFDTTKLIKTFTQRPIKIRYKEASKFSNIDDEICNSWCVVTHVSAAALDSLRLGTPVITTGNCAATPLAIPISKIDNPPFNDGRDELFSYLAWNQFTLDEYSTYNIVSNIKKNKLYTLSYV